MKWNIGRKITFGFGIILFLLAVIGVVVLINVADMQKQFTFVVEHDAPVIADARRLEKLVVDMETGQRGFVITHKEEFLEPYTAGVKEFEAVLAKEKQLVSDNPKQVRALERIEGLVHEWQEKAARPEIAAAREINLATGDADYLLKVKHVENLLVAGTGKGILDRLRGEFDQFVKIEEDLTAMRYASATSSASGTRNITVSFALFAIIFGSLVAFFIIRGISTPVLSTAGGVSASAQQLATSAQQTNESAQEVASTIQQLAKGAQRQAQGVEETSKVLEQLDASITQGAQSAQEAAAASSQAGQSAQKGAETVKAVIATVGKIETASSITSEAVAKLGKRSEQMSQIVDMITSVADQTNLLALNAAIEAARAGEAGKGFAVVADEVRKLAESSSRSATEIGQLIQETIRETGAAVKNMEATSNEITSGKELINSAGNALGEIIQSSEQVSSMLQEISASSQQMSSGAKQVVQSVEEVATIAEEASASTQQANASTQQMVATMQELAASSQSLAQMGIELRDLVGATKSDGKITPLRPAPPVPEPAAATPITVRLAEAKKKMEIAKPSQLPKAVGNGIKIEEQRS